MGWGVALSLVANLAGNSAQDRAAAQGQAKNAEALAQSSAVQEASFNKAMGYSEPYRQAGFAGLESLGDVPMGMTEQDMMRLQEGTDAMRAMQSAQGRRKAGGSAEQLGQYASGYMDDVYDRSYEDMMGRANMGSQAAQMAGQAWMGGGQNIASSYISGAQNQAQYLNAQGQGKANMYATLGKLGGDIANASASGAGGGGMAGGYNTDLDSDVPRGSWG